MWLRQPGLKKSLNKFYCERILMKKDSTPSNADGRTQVTIIFCPGCGWLLRSAWMAQEILTTFREEVDDLTLTPSKNESGVFQVLINEKLIWCRKRDDGFPEIKTLKQRIRDFVAPEKDLGHTDREKTS